MDMTNTQKANVATELVLMCRDCNSMDREAMDRLEGATHILHALDVPYTILWDGDTDHYTAVKLCGDVYTV